MTEDDPCPCGSAQAFSACCGPLLSGANHAATAVALMRSRYTAYCLKDAAYLLKTWHPDTCPAVLDFSGDDTAWAGLTIIRHAQGGAGDAEGTVEFSAAYRQGGILRQMRETSQFVRTADGWLYRAGEASTSAKPGRNDPCPCGSGKKYKTCGG